MVATRLASAMTIIAIHRVRYGRMYGIIRHRSELDVIRVGGDAIAGAA